MRRLMAILVLGAAASAQADEAATGRSQTVARKIGEDAPARGPDAAPVTLEVFCQYGHSQCAALETLLVKLTRRHPTRLRVVYRQVAYHLKDAPVLAQAAYEAHAQGRFLAFHEALYDKSGAATRRDLEAAAQRAGLDLEQLRAALADQRHLPAVEADARRREAYELRSIPALVWNGEQLPAVYDLESLEQTYDAFYAEAKRRLDDGMPIARLHATLVKEARDRRVEARRRDGLRRVEEDPEHDLRLAPRVKVEIGDAPMRGNPEGEVTIVMFGDFECPFCRNATLHLKKVEELFPDDVRIVFKHFPVAHHPNARLAAEAAACAARHDKFWPYFDVLYRNPRALKKDQLVKYAADQGLDADRFKKDLESGRCKGVVEDDIDQGRDLEVEGTPTIFVNGLRLVGQTGATQLRWIVEEELRPGILRQLTDEEELEDLPSP